MGKAIVLTGVEPAFPSRFARCRGTELTAATQRWGCLFVVHQWRRLATLTKPGLAVGATEKVDSWLS